MRLGLAIILLVCATATLAATPVVAPTPEAAAELKPAEAKPASDLKPVSDPKPGSEAKPAAAKKICLSAAETHEEIKGHSLREPFAALKSAAQHYKAEALSAKLCRIDDEFVYEIALLHKDGHYFHAYVNATTGKLVDPKRLLPSPPKP